MAGRKRRSNGDGWVYADGSAWRFKLQVGVDPVTGRPKYRSGRAATKTEATERLRKLQAEHLGGRVAPASRTNLGSFLDEWVETSVRKTRAASTYRQYRWLIDMHITPHLGKKRLEDVRRSDIQTLITSKSEQEVRSRSMDPTGTPNSKLSKSTLRLIQAVLRSAFNEAIRRDLLNVNPATLVVLPRNPKSPPVSLKCEEAIKLLRTANSTPLSDFWHFLFHSGTRLGEATGVRWRDVDLEGGSVLIRGQLQRVDGELKYLPGTKTNQERAVPLGQTMIARLRQLQGERDRYDDPDGLVFLNPMGRRLDPKYVRNQLRDLCVAAGVPVISPHKARHTAATLALGATGDMHAVQKMLGHSQVSLTADLYAHGTSESQRRVADALERALQSTEDD